MTISDAVADEIIVSQGPRIRSAKEFLDSPDSAKAKLDAINEILAEQGEQPLRI